MGEVLRKKAKACLAYLEAIAEYVQRYQGTAQT
jgi:hypothetical protein